MGYKLTKSDKNYIAARVALIPKAELYATNKVKEIGVASKQVEGKDGCMFSWSYWNEHFMKEMNRLAIETGLIKGVNRDELSV